MFTFNEKDIKAGNSASLNAMRAQYAYVNAHRDDPRHRLPTSLFSGLRQNAGVVGLVGNAGVSPRDLYREFDNTTVRQFRLDEGDNILNRLMPLARSINLGRTILEGARASGAGKFQTSMSGELSVIYDSVDYDSEKFIIPIHQNGFKRNWREGMQLSLEGFDDAVIQSSEAVRTHRNGVIDYMLDGTTIVHDGVGWQGFRNDSRVHQVDLGAAGLNVDFTSSTLTGEDARDAWVALRDQLWLENKVSAPATYFISNEAYSNFERYYTDNYASGTILEHLKRVGMVADIVQSSKLVGNEVLAIPLQSQFIQPIVGQAVSVIAKSRPDYNSPFAFDVVSAIGLKVTNDFEGVNKGVMYASS